MTKPVLPDKTSDGGTAACTAERPIKLRPGDRSTCTVVIFERKGGGEGHPQDPVVGCGVVLYCEYR